MEIKTLFFYLIVAIAIAALVIGIIALINANTANDNANTANSKSVSYTALQPGKGYTVINISETTPVSTNTVAPSLIYTITLPLQDWNFDGSNLGVLGNINTPFASTSSVVSMGWNVKYAKNSTDASKAVDLSGAVSQTTSATNSIVGAGTCLVNLNGITAADTFTSSDTITLFVYGFVFSTSSVATVTIVPQDIQTNSSDASITYGPIGISA
jgi:hypothetical protein